MKFINTAALFAALVLLSTSAHARKYQWPPTDVDENDPSYWDQLRGYEDEYRRNWEDDGEDNVRSSLRGYDPEPRFRAVE